MSLLLGQNYTTLRYIQCQFRKITKCLTNQAGWDHVCGRRKKFLFFPPLSWTVIRQDKYEWADFTVLKYTGQARGSKKAVKLYCIVKPYIAGFKPF